MSNTNYSKAEINRRLSVEHRLYQSLKDPLACSSRTFCNYSQPAGSCVAPVMPVARAGAGEISTNRRGV